jgi:hypothetical protein
MSCLLLGRSPDGVDLNGEAVGFQDLKGGLLASLWISPVFPVDPTAA